MEESASGCAVKNFACKARHIVLFKWIVLLVKLCSNVVLNVGPDPSKTTYWGGLTSGFPAPLILPSVSGASSSRHPCRQDEIQCPLPRTLLITPYQLAPSLLIDALQVVEPIMTHLGVDCPLASSLVSSCSLACSLSTYQLRLK